jgi:hypothetical protein
MSVHHSPSKQCSREVSRRSPTTSRTLGTPTWLLAEATVTSVAVQPLVENLKLMTTLATDANTR